MPKHYPFLDLGKVNAPYAEELKQACSRVVDSGRYIGGPEVEALERELAAMVGTRHAVGVASGLDALSLTLSAWIRLGRLAPGDEVLVPANTYFASVLAISLAGLTPVPVDADATTHNLDTELLDAALTGRTRAIMTVHLYGRPAFDTRLEEFASTHGLLVIEDAAQAIGAAMADRRRCGALGHAGCFSFYPTKNIGALGDAGAVTTDDDALADMLRSLRNYGSGDKAYYFDHLGANSRLDPIQAAMIRVKLPHTDRENDGRRAIAAIYNREITNPLVSTPDPGPDRHVYHQYVVTTEHRDALRRHLLDNGVETLVHYPCPPHMQKCYSSLAGYYLPVATQLASRVLSLPISPACTTTADARDIAAIINKFTI
ncbi:DegT/DnrJ/EryC1/StrS aminotransferase family protein [uncultured Muribaculum sp.]|uniref:DegT/DnrJ/EryC1/StrS family aminotransferase n=1 Tax=uncultured Muribaculum sp. TaxID=1918613 RepID=UPI0025F454FD|nr:DegT/DnrJ/EryC1/StrS family aminotransferase [uncultured Muribaculum sp.]